MRSFRLALDMLVIIFSLLALLYGAIAYSPVFHR
jgi:hypothetical protein